MAQTLNNIMRAATDEIVNIFLPIHANGFEALLLQFIGEKCAAAEDFQGAENLGGWFGWIEGSECRRIGIESGRRLLTVLWE